MDYTGTGNSLNVRHPHSLQLIMDSLRYWVTEMHVDGFRFDLASTLAREFYDVDRLATFFELVQQDPVVSQVKLIAEPWDVGPGGYQVGNFPPQWTEWNGAYRDTVRDFWRGEPSLGEFASRHRRVLRPLRALRPPAGRQHQLRHRPRRLHAARPGVLQREAQRGQRRGQQRRREPQPVLEPRRRGPDRRPRGPGSCGPASSATSSPPCCSARACRCSCTATSSAAPSTATTTPTPRTPRSAGCTGTRPTSRSIEFTAAVARLRASHPTFRRKRFFTGTTVRTGDGDGDRLNDIVWLHLDGRPMEDGDWDDGVAGDRHVPQRRRHRRHGRPRQPDHRRPLPALLQRRRRRPTVTLPAGRVRRRRGTSSSTPAARPTTRGTFEAGRDVPARAPAASSCSASTRSPRPSPTTRSPPRSAQLHGNGDASADQRPSASRPSNGRLQATGTASRSGTVRPREHLPAADHRGLRPVRGRAAAALPARPRRRLGLPVAAAGGRARQQPRVRRGRARPRSTPSRGGAEGLAALSARGPAARAWACWSTSCPTTSAWRRRPRTRGGGTCSQHGRESEHADAFDIDWAAGGGRIRIPVVGDDDRPRAADRAPDVVDGELRYHDHRFPIAPGTADDGADADTVHAASTTSWSTGAWPTTTSTTAASSRSTPWPRCGSRTPRCSPSRTSRSGAGSTRASSTGCASTTPTACATPSGYLDDLAELTGGAYVLVEKILEPGEQLPASLGDRGHHRVRRARATSTGCSPTRPARRRSTRSRPGCAAAPVDWHEMIHDTKRDRRRRDPALRGPPDRARAAATTLDDPTERRSRTRSPSCWPASRSTAPTCPRAASTSTRRSRWPGSTGPTWPAPSTSSLPVLADPDADRRKRFQQTSGMVMAKGVEDCAFYRWSRLDLAQRGRRRPVGLRGRRPTSSTTAMADPPARVAATR